MNLVATIKKLRAAADILEDLLYEGTSTKALAKRLPVVVHDSAADAVKKRRKRTGKHWTQRPENAAKVKYVIAKARRANMRKARGTRGA